MLMTVMSGEVVIECDAVAGFYWFMLSTLPKLLPDGVLPAPLAPVVLLPARLMQGPVPDFALAILWGAI